MKELSKLTILLFLSIFNILPVILSKTPHKCVVEVLRERRENVSGTEFCWTWGFSCPSLTEEIVRKTENVTMCCPGFLEDIDGNCQEIEEDIGFSGEELELEEEDEIFQTGALLEELVAVLEHLVNRGDNPEIVIRQASERFF